MKHYFTRSPIYNDYRWFCLYIGNIAMYTLVLDRHTGVPQINETHSHYFNSTIIPLADLKINRWEI